MVRQRHRPSAFSRFLIITNLANIALWVIWSAIKGLLFFDWRSGVQQTWSATREVYNGRLGAWNGIRAGTGDGLGAEFCFFRVVVLKCLRVLYNTFKIPSRRLFDVIHSLYVGVWFRLKRVSGQEGQEEERCLHRSKQALVHSCCIKRPATYSIKMATYWAYRDLFDNCFLGLRKRLWPSSWAWPQAGSL